MNHHPLMIAGDVFSLAAIAASWAGYLPDIAAAIAAVWYIIHIWEWWHGRKVD